MLTETPGIIVNVENKIEADGPPLMGNTSQALRISCKLAPLALPFDVLVSEEGAMNLASALLISKRGRLKSDDYSLSRV
jgi:hypothetical protein